MSSSPACQTESEREKGWNTLTIARWQRWNMLQFCAYKPLSHTHTLCRSIFRFPSRLSMSPLVLLNSLSLFHLFHAQPLVLTNFNTYNYNHSFFITRGDKSSLSLYFSSLSSIWNSVSLSTTAHLVYLVLRNSLYHRLHNR